MSILLEIMADSIESALSAQKGGADRIELCENLVEGGTTPSPGLIQMTVDLLDIEVNVMIRPRGGDFHYSDLEFQVMKNNIQFCKTAGVSGVVLGLLNVDGTIDEDRTAELVDLARPMSVTFHRAFDMTIKPFAALEALIDIGVDRILTSGQKQTAIEGADLIQQLVQRSKGAIKIIAGSGVNESNIADLVQQTGVQECHSSAKMITLSKMEYQKMSLFMGRENKLSEFENIVVDAQKVKMMRQAVKSTQKAF